MIRRFVAVGVCVLLGVALFQVVPAQADAFQAQAVGALAPVGDVRGGDNAYEYDVINRTIVLPTYAAIVGDRSHVRVVEEELGLTTRQRRSITVHVESSALHAVITVVVTGPRRDLVGQVATAVLAAGQRFIDSLHSSFVLTPLAGIDTTGSPVKLLRPRWLAVLLAGWLVLAYAVVRLGRPRTHVPALVPEWGPA